MRKYYVYILKCSDGSYYTGVTNNIDNRLWEHETGIDPKSFTFRRRPVELVYLTDFLDVKNAIDWEKTVKSWTRAKKEAMMREEWERLPGLAKKKFKRS